VTSRRSLSAGASAVVLGLALVLACASPPKRTAHSLRLDGNPRAVVEGRVRDLDGRPAAGLGVRGIPRGSAIPWLPPATTACDGTFRLSLAAPGDYGFLLLWHGRAVVTADPRDPALTEISLDPGEAVSGVELTFLAEEWRAISPEAPEDTPSCP
jgi:hypothetical protein